MTSQYLNGLLKTSRFVRAPLAGRGLGGSLLALLALGAVPNSWAGDCNIVVGSTADSGGTCTVYPTAPNATCTLRQAIATATTGRTICFAAGLKGQTITLTTQSDSTNYPGTALLIKDKNLNIDGYGNGVIISGNQLLRIFYITNSAVQFNGLILQKGKTFLSDQGAAVYVDKSSLTIRDSTLKENLSAYDGGAIYNTNASILNITRSTFNDNEAAQSAGGRGGAVFIAAGNLTISNNTFYNNKASDGGGIYVFTGSQFAIAMNNNTFAKNQISSTGLGGNIFIGGGATLKNNIFTDSVNNLSAPVEDCYKDTLASVAGNNNLIVRQSAVSDNRCLAIIDTNVDNSGVNLNLTLGNNGGPTQTAAINSTMIAAYNTGDNVTCADVPVNNIDQRGVIRPQYPVATPTCDKGAYEASAKAGGNKVTLVKKGQCITPCSGSSADLTYPQLSLNGVCWAYVNLRNDSGRTLRKIRAELVSVTNNNWVLNTNTIPAQGVVAGTVGVAVPVLLNTDVDTAVGGDGCTDLDIPAATGSAETLLIGRTINVWYKVGMMSAGPYTLTTKLFVTDPNATPMSFGVNNVRRPVAHEELGEFTVDFNSQEEEILPILKPISGDFKRLVTEPSPW